MYTLKTGQVINLSFTSRAKGKKEQSKQSKQKKGNKSSTLNWKKKKKGETWTHNPEIKTHAEIKSQMLHWAIQAPHKIDILD